MRAKFTPPNWLPILAAMVLASPVGALAQAFAADYELAPNGESSGYGQPSQPGRWSLSMVPAVQSDSRFAGTGLSIAAGQNWFARVAVGRSLASGFNPNGAAQHDALAIAGGYRWSDGQALSLQVTGARTGGNRLGLSVSYDWPRYFVRLSWDSGLNPVPQDHLRFSAGMRF